MKHAISAVVGVVLVLVLALGTVFSTSTPAQAAEEACIINVLGVKVCGTLLGQPLPEIVTVTVTAPPITLPPRTVTVSPEPVRVTTTVTAQPQAQPTATATETVTTGPQPVGPQPTVTETVRPNGRPVPTVTETVTQEVEQSTGQSVSPSDTVEPSTEEEDPFLSTDIDFGDDSVTAGEAGVGILGAMIIVALILGGMFYGFRRGLATSEYEETHFLRGMLDRSKTK